MASAKRISALTASINLEDVIGNPDREITGITYDSRQVRPGYLFVALPGIHADGHAFVEQALDRGAAGVVIEREIPGGYRPDAFYLQVADSRIALSALSADFNDHPSHTIPVIGVTGTDGKSTTVSLIRQLIEFTGRPAGFLSTVEYRTGNETKKNPYRQSTPEASEIHSILREMIANGKRAAVVEATSHGLSERTARLRDVRFDVAVITNVTHEHLEFHGSVEQYRQDKANLFRSLDRAVRKSDGPSEPFGVVNLDDPYHRIFLQATRRKVYGYSLSRDDADLRASHISLGADGTDFRVVHEGRESTARLGLPGIFNVENVLAALLAASRFTDFPIGDLISRLPDLEGVRGRMYPLRMGQPFSAVVDYAHTPGSFLKLLPMMREATPGRLIVLFGSAGERDIQKRPVQGELACRWADIIVLADEDPRGDDRMEILEEIARGCPGKRRGEELLLIPDREEAIRRAFGLARDGDTVLLLGKGHESSIIYADGPIPWDEIEVATRILGEMGFGPERT